MSGKLTLKGSIWHFMDPETVKAHGPWVRHSDYAQLERDLAEARAAAERQWEGWIKEEALRKAAEAERDRLAASRDGYAKAEKARAEEQYRLAAQCDIYKRGLETLASTFYKGDQHQDYAKHVLDAAARAPLQNGENEG